MKNVYGIMVLRLVLFYRMKEDNTKDQIRANWSNMLPYTRGLDDGLSNSYPHSIIAVQCTILL
ncbi:hypothetical protein BOW52_08225 [Solemya elarraichensis gill symbiont]|uniref:Uncharacterized protein n=1 Tax=Solemya elarraichensis gill symbiont TaxID=1918949 RepID=A0A1T2L0P2_9GAMM|nr:hypothetical protein BOW52_08225 [Solemya elarraichensis gill symbiont]